MPLRVLIAPDKFKGTLTAAEAARAIARGWRRGRPDDELTLLPITDGGDGFGEVLRRTLQARPRQARTVDAAHRPITAPWWHDAASSTAVVESARVIGLAMLPAGRYHPFELDTFGLAAVLAAAARTGCRRCLLGIGGSATNDGGFGLATALGWRFVDDAGAAVRRWTELSRLRTVIPPEERPFPNMQITVAVDVQNPLLGPRGATRVYGPQKGVRPEDRAPAEACLRRLAAVARRQLGRDDAARPGSGAAGGLGFGLMAFAGSRLRPGFALFAERAHLEDRLEAADLVITGEGALDRSTLMGKGVGELARLCRARGRPCLGIGGRVTEARALRRWFAGVHALAPDLVSVQEALADPRRWLGERAWGVARAWPPGQAHIPHAGSV